MLEKLLQQNGYTVDSVSNGEEGIKLYEQNLTKYKIIITDIQLPDLNGFEVVKALNKISNSNKPYIIGMTAGIVDQNDNTFDLLIYKPINIKDVCEKIKSLI